MLAYILAIFIAGPGWLLRSMAARTQGPKFDGQHLRRWDCSDMAADSWRLEKCRDRCRDRVADRGCGLVRRQNGGSWWAIRFRFIVPHGPHMSRVPSTSISSPASSTVDSDAPCHRHADAVGCCFLLPYSVIDAMMRN